MYCMLTYLFYDTYIQAALAIMQKKTTNSVKLGTQLLLETWLVLQTQLLLKVLCYDNQLDPNNNSKYQNKRHDVKQEFKS